MDSFKKKKRFSESPEKRGLEKNAFFQRERIGEVVVVVEMVEKVENSKNPPLKLEISDGNSFEK